MTTYVATINVPGYLPMDDEPPTFEEAREAWDYLLDQRRDGEDSAFDAGLSTEEGYSACLNQLEQAARGEGEVWANSPDGTGTIYGETPGYDGDHDLGLVYSVTEVEPE